MICQKFCLLLDGHIIRIERINPVHGIMCKEGLQQGQRFFRTALFVAIHGRTEQRLIFSYDHIAGMIIAGGAGECCAGKQLGD